jgi:hypothetical protein
VVVFPVVANRGLRSIVQGRYFTSRSESDRMGQGLLSVSFDRWCKMHQRNVRARWAVLGDVRIRQVGHFIRKTRLDELPQVINRVRVCLCRERSTLTTRSVNVTKSSIVCGHCPSYRILLLRKQSPYFKNIIFVQGDDLDRLVA